MRKFRARISSRNIVCHPNANKWVRVRISFGMYESPSSSSSSSRSTGSLTAFNEKWAAHNGKSTKNIEGNNNSDTFIWSSLPYIYVQQILNRRIIPAYHRHSWIERQKCCIFIFLFNFFFFHIVSPCVFFRCCLCLRVCVHCSRNISFAPVEHFICRNKMLNVGNLR